MKFNIADILSGIVKSMFGLVDTAYKEGWFYYALGILLVLFVLLVFFN